MLKTLNIHKSYRLEKSELHVLKGIDVKIAHGEFVAIVGPSGAGKSTLLHILGGLDTPDKGCVYLDDQDLYAMNDNARAVIRNKSIGFVFQFYHLLPEFSALENIMLPFFVREKKREVKKAESRCQQLLEKVGLKDRMSHKPSQLSGGEQQRVAIARSLVNEPNVIFCDEPTGNLDSKSGQEIIGLLQEFNQKDQRTVVIVTHDKELAARTHRTIHMRDGLLENV